MRAFVCGVAYRFLLIGGGTGRRGQARGPVLAKTQPWSLGSRFFRVSVTLTMSRLENHTISLLLRNTVVCIQKRCSARLIRRLVPCVACHRERGGTPVASTRAPPPQACYPSIHCFELSPHSPLRAQRASSMRARARNSGVLWTRGSPVPTT
jgi:hypothetical protein